MAGPWGRRAEGCHHESVRHLFPDRDRPRRRAGRPAARPAPGPVLLIPEASGPHDPVAVTPGRVPGSVRRTSTIDTARPDGIAGELVVTARARDLRTGTDGRASVLGEAGLEARAAASWELRSLSTEPSMPASGRLIGARVGPGFRGRVAETGPDGPEVGSLLHLLLDDLPGAVLVSGYAVQRAGGFESNGPDVLPEAAASKARETMATMGDDRCAGWAHDATMMVTIRERGTVPVSQGPPAPTLEPVGDPLAWHPMEPLGPHAMRRRRRLDVIRRPPRARPTASTSTSVTAIWRGTGPSSCSTSTRCRGRSTPAASVCSRWPPSARAALDGMPPSGGQRLAGGRDVRRRAAPPCAPRAGRRLDLHPSQRHAALARRPGRPHSVARDLRRWRPPGSGSNGVVPQSGPTKTGRGQGGADRARAP